MAANKKKRQRHLAKERARKAEYSERYREFMDENFPGRLSMRPPAAQTIPLDNIHWSPVGAVVERNGMVVHQTILDEMAPMTSVDLRDVFKTTRTEHAHLLDHVVTRVLPWWGGVIFDCTCGRRYEGQYAEENMDSHLRAYRMWLNAHPDEEVLIALGGKSTWMDNPNSYH